MARAVLGIIGFAALLLVDPTSGIRGNGYQVEWEKVGNQYRKGTIQVQLNGAVTGGKNEIVQLTIDATGGTYTATFGAQTTTAIAEAGTAAVVQAALEALSTIGAGNVRVTGANGGPYLIEFIGALGLTDVGAITTNAASLTGGAGTAVPVVLVTGAPSPTSITVDALPGVVYEGAHLDFGSGRTGLVTANAALGATTLAVSQIGTNIPDNATSYIYGTGPKVLPAGLAMGKAGSTSGKKMYPRVVTSNPAIGLLIEEVWEDNPQSGLTGFGLYEAGYFWENRLPDAVANGGTLPSAIKTELGSRFIYKMAENNAATS